MASAKSFTELCHMNYGQQAIWYLNGFWARGAEAEAENVWKFASKFIELDQAKKAAGNQLDEFASHKFLESLEQTMTVMEMRSALREIDTDANGHMALLEYLIWRYKYTPAETAAAPQGGADPQAIENAQAMFDEVNAALSAQIEAVAQLDAAVAELEAAIRETDQLVADVAQALAETEALTETVKAAVVKTKAAVAELQASEAELASAEAELNAAIAGLKAEEDAYHGAIAKAEAIINDESASTVKKSKASNELAQLKSEDPMPLRRAKITQEAALRKVQKQKTKVAAAREAQEAVQAEQEAKQAELEAKQAELEAKQAELEAKKVEQQAKQVEMETAKAAAEAQQVELEARMAEASAELEKVKSMEGTPDGFIWWMQRTEIEADKYLPPNKQKYAHLHRKFKTTA